MRKTIAFLALFLVIISCKDSAIEKPDNLIAEDKMIDILSDVAILEAIRVENPSSLAERNIVPDKYIYKKYKIDSLQFSSSDKYYASDVDNYLKMYEKVSKNIEKKRAETDSLIAKGINVGTPKSHQGEIKKEKIMPFKRLFNK